MKRAAICLAIICVFSTEALGATVTIHNPRPVSWEGGTFDLTFSVSGGGAPCVVGLFFLKDPPSPFWYSELAKDFLYDPTRPFQCSQQYWCACLYGPRVDNRCPWSPHVVWNFLVGQGGGYYDDLEGPWPWTYSTHSGSPEAGGISFTIPFVYGPVEPGTYTIGASCYLGGQEYNVITGTLTVVPEPSVLCVAGLGLVGIVMRRRCWRR